jgi:APA family basic amino acid/polyamine antiporter
VVEAFKPKWLADVLKYAVAIAGAAGLFAAAGSAMLGVSRVGYSLATNRQIPSAIGRLHEKWGTPYVIIGAATVAAAALVLPTDLEFLVGIYAFGAMLAFTIAHASVVALRFREPDRERDYRVPFSVSVRGAQVPVPAVVGAIGSALGLVAVLVFHSGARYVGLAWLAAGLTLYVIYRKTQQKPLLKRVTIPERALRYEALEPEFGSILVPILGTALDDDIIQTAGRLAGETRDDLESEGAMIEAIWVFEIPLALPMDAPLPDAQVKRAREALARAKLVGEEYEGVEVATAIVRGRRSGEAIVREARRRGVEAIVLAAEESTRVRGGALLGGVGGPLENYVGDVSRYVISKAPCRVILTAPPAGWRAPSRDQPPAPSDDGKAAAPDDPIAELDAEGRATLAQLEDRSERGPA